MYSRAVHENSRDAPSVDREAPILESGQSTMKRITYISKFSRPLSLDDLDSISEVSVRNNKRDGLTGALFCFRNIFYQILEGDEEAVDRCFARIEKDDRHSKVFVLQVEQDIDRRKYSEWEMRTVILDESTDPLMRPIRNLLASLANTHRTLERYTPQRVLEEIEKGGLPDEIASSFQDRTVMFVDLFRSTSIFESWSVENATMILHRFYDTALKAIKEYGGIISKLTGDGIMAYWPRKEAAGALKASARFLADFEQLRARSGESDNPLRLLYAGVGLSTGRVLEGNIGSSIYMDYTLLGDTVNTAARLEGVTRKAGWTLIFDNPTLEAVKENPVSDLPAIRKVGKFRPAGKSEPIEIYTLDLNQLKMTMNHENLQREIQALGNA